MKRLTEELQHSAIYAPQEVAANTLTTTNYVDVSGVPEVAFFIATGALAQGKKLTVQLMASNVPAGTGAVKIAEQVLIADAPLNAGLAVVSYKPSTQFGRYVGIKFKHDAAAAVVCGVTATLRQREIPAENGWTVNA